MLNPSLKTPVLPAGYNFHHIGYATANLTKEIEFFQFLGYSPEGQVFCDPKQGIRGCFLTGPGPRIELLENLDDSQTLTPWINSGVKMYHFAYFVDELEQAIEWARTQRARLVAAPMPSVAFNSCRICFIMFRNSFMVEFIETKNCPINMPEII